MSDRVQDLFHTKIRKVVLDHERGVDLKAIAERVGVSPPTVAKWLNQEGYKRKGAGRVPLAMKARVRDLHLRGWDDSHISRLLGLRRDQVAEWSRPLENPILGGERDPLKVRGERRRKKDKAKPRKRGRPKKPEGAEVWPPARHRCRKHWTAPEKAFVLQLIENGITPLAIYRRTRASRSRQLKIWRSFGNEGPPPNFPPPKDGAPIAAQMRSAAAKKPSAAALAAEDRDAAQIEALEQASKGRQARIAELEALVEDERRQIEELEADRQRLQTARKEQALRLAQARAAAKKLKPAPPAAGRRKVLPESYESEVLGLKPGTFVEPKAAGRPAAPALVSYADNGRTFAVSQDWTDLEDATPDELVLFAQFLSNKGFPAKVEKSGDQPASYLESKMPKKVEDKWTSVVDGGLNLLEKYSKRKRELQAKKMYSKGIATYLANAYDAYANPKISKMGKELAQEDLEDNWARLKKMDRLILTFAMKVSKPDGTPTSLGVERGRAAKIRLQKDAETKTKRLSESWAEAAKPTVRQVEKDEVESMLSAGRLALEEGDED